MQAAQTAPSVAQSAPAPPALAAPSAPDVPALAPNVVAGVAAAGDPPPTPRNADELRTLKSHRSLISDQLSSVQNRRDELAKQLRNPMVTGADRGGIEQRLGVLDARIIQLERDLDYTGRQIAGATSTVQDEASRPSRGERRAGPPFGAGVMLGLLLALILTRLLGRQRRFGPPRGRPLPDAADSARLARVEQAVEAVAIEVERIAEGQRFVAQLLAPRPGEARPTVAAPAAQLGER